MKLHAPLFYSCLLFGLQGTLAAAYIGDSKAPLALPAQSLELTYTYGAMNNTLDVFNVKESEFGSTKTQQTNGIGDYTANTLLFNYSPLDDVLLNLTLSSQTIGYGQSSLDVFHYETYARYLFKPSSRVTIGADIGLRGNKGKKISMTSSSDIQYYLNSLGKNIQASETEKYLFLTNNDNGSYIGFPKSDHPELSIDNMSDQTFYGRSSIAMPFNIFVPSLYVEIGHTAVSATIDTNMDDIAGDSFKTIVSTYFPISLDRSENYASAGFNVRADTPFDTTLTANYEYKKLFRDNALSTFNTNHTVQMQLSYAITPELGCTIGGTYLYRQFNGTIPFLYNRYTQNSFDHPFGWVHLGISYTFTK